MNSLMRIANIRRAIHSAVVLACVTAFVAACGELTGPESPSTPTDVVATLLSASSASVSWTPSPKNDGVISYSIFRNGAKIGESTTTTFTDTGLAQQTTYVYSVAANCKSGIVSDRSLETTASTITTVDITAPTIVSHQPPTNFNGVSPAATVTVTFSEPMDAATINATTFNLKITNGAAIAGVVTYNAATRTATLTPSASLPNPANFTATVTTGVKDVAGNALAAAFSWTFTTRDDTPPSITAIVPANGATGVSPTATVQITFSENMDATTINATNITLKTTSSGTAVAGTVAYNTNTRIATFTPSAPLAQTAGYTVTVSGVKDAAGNLFVNSFTSTFTTGDTNAPTVITVVPANGTTGVALNSNVKVTFSEAMDGASINTTTITLRNTATSAAVAGTVAYDNATNTATFTPSSNLTSGTNYTLTVSTGAKDAAGNPMASAFTSTFTAIVIDTSAPTVASVLPANGTIDVPANSAVQITFSEAMDASTITSSNITLRNTATSALIPAAVTYNTTTHVATLTPSSALAANTGYTVGVSTGVKDAAGNAMASAFSSSFTTTNPPTIVGVSPTTGATGVPIAAAVSVIFSEPMDQSTITTTNITLRNTATSAVVAGTISYNVGTNTATFTPSGPLSNGTNYTLTVTSGVKDLAGNALASTFTSNFTTANVTDTTPPTIVSRTPANGTTNVAINSNITVTFNEDMSLATITPSTITLAPTSSPGTPVTATVSCTDATCKTVTLDPAADLANNTSYTLTVTTGVKDVAGNALVANSASTFTTVADTTPPTITGTSPLNGATGVAVSSAITVTFSEPMDQSTINTTTFTVKTTSGSVPVAGTVSYNTTTRVATFTPASALTANTSYTVTVTTGAKDLAGNALAVNASFAFTTAP
jgi:hypothetical protein